MKAKSQDNSDCFKWLNEPPKACYLWLPMESPATGVQSLLRCCSAVCLQCSKRVPTGLRQFGKAVDRSWPRPRDCDLPAGDRSRRESARVSSRKPLALKFSP